MALRDRLRFDEAATEEPGGGLEMYRRLLREEVDIDELSRLNHPQKRARLERIMGDVLSREGPLLTPRERTTVIRRVVDESLGLGVLELLLADDSITEIMVNGPADIFVERDGRLEQVPLAFAGEDQLYQTIDRIVSGVNRRIDESSPMVDARLPTGERVNVIIPPLSLSGPAITIRRFPKLYSLEQLVERGSLDDATGELLGTFVRARMNIVVSGGTGTGKTTMLNALSAFIPDEERIITIEDAAELQLQKHHLLRLEARPANVEGGGQVTIRDLVRNSLRMRPDRIVLGEVRGGETLDMLQAMNTGHEGSLCTVHANSANDAILRLETLASMAELAIPFTALRDQINSAIDILVQLERFPDGSRRIVEVVAVTSRRQEAYQLVPLASFEAEPLKRDRVFRGRFSRHPVPKRLVDRLLRAGERLPRPFVAAGDTAVDGRTVA